MRAAESLPRIWLLVGEKTGDNAQLRVIADALGFPVEERHVAMQSRWARGKPRVRASLDHIDPARSDRLEPPWPDLLLTAGRRLSSVALWVREQSQGRTRLVLVGKPKRLARRFDLIVASAQYRVARRPNVLQVGLPLMRLDAAAVAAAGAAWRERLAALPRPLTALLVGGPTKQVRFGAAVARDLARRAAAAAGESGGSLYVTTSRRTPAEVEEALRAGLPPDTRFYCWRPDARAGDNPYLALLALADRHIVTSDSVTMMVEVARLARPLAIFALPPVRWSFLSAISRSRDLEAVPKLLIDQGNAVPLGKPFRTPAAPPRDELPRVVEAIRSLLHDRSAVPTGAPGAV